MSPWSRGGWVNAQVFDHTSVIRFLEARHGVMEPNISAWRRAVAGDLTSALDFSGERDHAGEPPGGHAISTRRNCALPYALEAVGRMTADGESYRLTFRNPGSAGAVLHVYDRLDLSTPPRRYTLGAGSRLDDGWRLSARGDYGLWLLGPDGFHREFRGDARDGGLLEAQLVPVSAGLRLRLINHGEAHQPMKVESRIGDGWRAVAHAGRRRDRARTPAAKAGTTWRSPCRTCRPSDAGWRVASRPASPACRIRGCDAAGRWRRGRRRRHESARAAGRLTGTATRAPRSSLGVPG